MSLRTGRLPIDQTPVKPLIQRHGGRVIHFIDIENIAGGPALTVESVRRAKQIYLRSGVYELGDLIYIACSRANGVVTGLGWPEGHLVCATGRDGADFELIEAIKRERVPERFAQVVIASGDGIFSTRAEVLRRAGVEVTVIAPVGGLSNRLRQAASSAILIDTDKLRWFFHFLEQENA